MKKIIKAIVDGTDKVNVEQSRIIGIVQRDTDEKKAYLYKTFNSENLALEVREVAA